MPFDEGLDRLRDEFLHVSLIGLFGEDVAKLHAHAVPDSGDFDSIVVDELDEIFFGFCVQGRPNAHGDANLGGFLARARHGGLGLVHSVNIIKMLIESKIVEFFWFFGALVLALFAFLQKFRWKESVHLKRQKKSRQVSYNLPHNQFAIDGSEEPNYRPAGRAGAL